MTLAEGALALGTGAGLAVLLTVFGVALVAVASDLPGLARAAWSFVDCRRVWPAPVGFGARPKVGRHRAGGRYRPRRAS